MAESGREEWLVMGTDGLLCRKCWRTETMPQPMPVAAFTPWAHYVKALHQDCVQAPEPKPGLAQWYEGHDTGISSKAIYRHFNRMAQHPTWGAGYPRDPSDFGRCHRLLELAPDWRARIGEMSKYGKVWTALAEHWDELTALYFDELPTGTCRKLYDRMKELGA